MKPATLPNFGLDQKTLDNLERATLLSKEKRTKSQLIARLSVSNLLVDELCKVIVAYIVGSKNLQDLINVHSTVKRMKDVLDGRPDPPD